MVFRAELVSFRTSHYGIRPLTRNSMQRVSLSTCEAGNPANKGGNTEMILSSFVQFSCTKDESFFFSYFTKRVEIEKNSSGGERIMAFIELQNVTKAYPRKDNTIHALNGVSLEVDKGDVFGIVGYSGAGKSTLVRLLNGLELPSTGEVIVNGQSVTALKNKELRTFRKKIGMIFQHFNLLWSRTLQENVELPLELAGVSKAKRTEKALELLALVGLEGREKAYPSELSGGQKQRVGIARALANDPEILLCDEATSALDPQTTEEVLNLLKEINEKLHLTIVLITHEMDVVRQICNKVAVMEKGQVVEEGTVVEVFRHPKEAITKRFVRQNIEMQADEELLQTFLTENPTGRIVTLTFKENNANEPVISQAIRQFPVDINVVFGKIQQAKEGAFGSLTILITGAESAIEDTLAFFATKQVETEVVTHE